MPACLAILGCVFLISLRLLLDVDRFSGCEQLGWGALSVTQNKSQNTRGDRAKLNRAVLSASGTPPISEGIVIPMC